MKRTLAILITALTALAANAAPGGTEEGKAVRTRPRPAVERDAAVARPQAAELPADLRPVAPPETAPAVAGASSSRPAPGAAPTGPRAGTAIPSATLDAEAREAARWAAADAVRDGRREYYRVGWYRGIRRALDDPALGGWDYALGLRLGSRDGDARRAGLDEGARRARAEAVEAAEARVEAQFTDLAREPVRDPRSEAPPFVAGDAWVETPTLEAVFADYPPLTAVLVSSRTREAFREWRYDPWTLSRCGSHGEFFRTSWNDPSAAFSAWASDRRRARFWYALTRADERGAFRATFDAEFVRAIALRHAAALERAYREGWDDGWDYGTVVVFDYHYRLGWAEGYARAASEAASEGYARAWAPEYRAAYDDAFARWSDSAVPGVLDVVLVDGNDDGVFEPGETVAVEIRAVNYGGGAATLPVTVEGARLSRAHRAEVATRGRGTLDAMRPLTVVLDAGAPVRSTATLDVAVGEATYRASVRVGRPLEIGSGIGLDADALAGRARVEIEVVNRSRRAVAGAVRAERLDGRVEPALEVGTLAPGASRTVVASFEEVRPADLVGGTFGARFAVVSGGIVQDEIDWRAPDRASDLDSRDFVRWVERLAADPATSPRDLDEARAMLVRRLDADWRRAARGRGNPYKDDLKDGTATTAVGELVRIRESAGRGGDRVGVFEALADEILARTDELPGGHPFLRKSLRKLAGRLG